MRTMWETFDPLLEGIEAKYPGVSVWLLLLTGAALFGGAACCCCGCLIYIRQNWHDYGGMTEDVTELTRSKGWWSYNFSYVAVMVGFFVMSLAAQQLALASHTWQITGSFIALFFAFVGFLTFLLKWGLQWLLDAIDTVSDCFRGEGYEIEFVYEWTCSTNASSLCATFCSPALCMLAAPTVQIFGERNKMAKPKRVWRLGKWWGGHAIDVYSKPFDGRRTGVQTSDQVNGAHPELRVSDQITRLVVHISKWAMPGARKLEFIDIELPRSALLLYIHTITVRQRKPGKVKQSWEFPAYVKLGGNTRFARVFEGESTIARYDAQEVRDARKDQLTRNKELWRWKEYTSSTGLANKAWGEGTFALPAALDAGQQKLLGFNFANQAGIPLNSLFGVAKAQDFYLNVVQAVVAQFASRFKGGGADEPWKDAQDVLSTFECTSLSQPQLWTSVDVTQAWQEDDELGAQLLMGMWPDSLSVATKLPPKLALALQKKTVPGHGKRTFAELARQKRLLLTDLSALGDYSAYAQKGGAIVGAYVVSVRVEAHPSIKVVAILLWWTDNGRTVERLYLPPTALGGDTEMDWLLAKTYVRHAMATYHQVSVHALRCHICMEPFVMAARRCLSTKHPVYKMLWPHIRYTLMINFLARATLIGPGGVFDMVSSIGGPKQGHIKLMADEYARWHVLDEHLPSKLSNAGLMPSQGTFPEGTYPYRDAALPVWYALHEYVERTLKTVYKVQADISGDTELQDFLNDLQESGFPLGRFSAAEFNSSAEALTELFTTIIWTVSARHAAVNFLQYEQMAYGPNMPLWMSKYPPPKGQVQSVGEALSYMCTRRASVGQAAVTWILSEYGSPWLMLNQPGSGDRYQELFSAGPQLDAVHWLSRIMDELEVEAKQRARTTSCGSNLQYVVLVPSNIPTSVAI